MGHLEKKGEHSDNKNKGALKMLILLKMCSILPNISQLLDKTLNYLWKILLRIFINTSYLQ